MSIIREPGCSGSNDVNIAARSSVPSIPDETSPGLADLTDVIRVEDQDDGAVVEAEIVVNDTGFLTELVILKNVLTVDEMQ